MKTSIEARNLEFFSNKIFRSATFEGMADEDGFPTKGYVELYCDLASKNVKNIITGFCYVSAEGKAIHPGQTGIDSDDKIKAFREVTEAVHQFGSKIYLQIAHTGRQTSENITHKQVVSSSAQKSKYFRSKPKELTIPEIEKIIDDFALAAWRAQQAGFDGIQLHAAHGYLIHQFIHPQINRRKDVYGIKLSSGIGERFLAEIIKAIRTKCGKEFPVLIKISASDSLSKPFTKNQFISLMKLLDRLKIAFIEISFGTMENALNIFRGESIPLEAILMHNFHYQTKNKLKKKIWKLLAVPFLKKRFMKFTYNYNLDQAKLAKKYTNTPIICVGGFRKGTDIVAAIENGFTDYVSICRPLICEPDFIMKLSEDNYYISFCENCNVCAIMCDSSNYTKCYHKQRSGK